MKRLTSIKSVAPIESVALIAALLLAGCTVGPDYHNPDIAVPPAFHELPADKTAAPFSLPVADQHDISAWWNDFGDDELRSLIARALKDNPDLRTASSRLRAAREQEIIAGAAGLPQVNANATAAHLHSGSSLLQDFGSGGSASSGSGATSSSGGTDIKLYSLGFDATWEVDVFGGTRRSVEAAADNREAAIWQMHDGEVSLTAEIGTDYFTLRTLQARIAILKEEDARQQGTQQLVAARAKTGFVTQLDVNQQITQRATTNAQIPSLEAQARIIEHAIAVLTGAAPETLIDELETAAPAVAIPATLPVGLPSDLLRRRPDVRTAERQLASATAEVGVAVADLYPKFNLLAGIAVTSNHLSNLFSSDSLGEFGLGSIMWPIFNAGRIDANIQARQEARQQAYFAYQKAVLVAIRDAEDAITRYTTEQRRLATLQASLVSATSSSDIAVQQYRVGLVTYVNVLTAQANELSVRDQLEQSRQAFATDLVSLYKALGGGWSDTVPTP